MLTWRWYCGCNCVAFCNAANTSFRAKGSRSASIQVAEQHVGLPQCTGNQQGAAFRYQGVQQFPPAVGDVDNDKTRFTTFSTKLHTTETCMVNEAYLYCESRWIVLKQDTMTLSDWTLTQISGWSADHWSSVYGVYRPIMMVTDQSFINLSIYLYIYIYTV